MNFRFYFTMLLCVGVSFCPIQTGAQVGQNIDLRNLEAPPTDTVNIPVSAPTVEQSVNDRIIQRRLQFRQRRATLRYIARLRRVVQVDSKTIPKGWISENNSLYLIVTNHRALQQLITLANRRSIDLVKSFTTTLRKRSVTEERAMAEVIRKMHEEKLDNAKQAPHQTVTSTEKRTGEVTTKTENLPLLSKTIDPIRHAKLLDLPAKLTSPISPTTSTQPEVNTSFPFVQPHTPASLKEAAELEALIAYKKQKALDRAKQAKRQSEILQISSSKAEKTRKLRELVDLYVSEKISPREYYSRRELILGKTTLQDKK